MSASFISLGLALVSVVGICERVKVPLEPAECFNGRRRERERKETRNYGASFVLGTWELLWKRRISVGSFEPSNPQSYQVCNDEEISFQGKMYTYIFWKWS